ncbi:MAG: carboxylating nicotinate-nucleotide diphosphorylase, partial [Lentisphaeria bacterium]
MAVKLNKVAITNLVRACLAEDQGSGDVTTLATVPSKTIVKAKLVTREECVCAGLDVAEAVFFELDQDADFIARVKEGEFCPVGTVLAEIEGNAQAILTGERLALNFLQRMCGIATMARKYVLETEGTNCKILDTRKTTPGLRHLEKYSVAVGGAENHRIGLYDRAMIKDNHRELASLEGPGGITRSVERCREMYPTLEVEVEADSLEEVKEAVEVGADYILLDNMSNEQMVEAVKINAGRSKLEASGGITLERIRSVAATGVDYISV